MTLDGLALPPEPVDLRALMYIDPRVSKWVKVDKDTANYRKANVPGENCDVCKFMNDDGTCQRVKGLVEPDNVCDLFEK